MKEAILIIALSLVIYFDLSRRQIPNAITFPLLLFGLLNSFYSGSSIALRNHLLTAFLVFLFFLPFYLLGVFGAGDLKLITSVSAISGPLVFLAILINTVFLASIIALLELTRKGLLRESFRQFYWFLIGIGLFKNFSSNEAMVRIPYGVAISLGAILSLFWNPWSF